MLRNWHDQAQDARQARLEDFADKTFWVRFEASLEHLKESFDFVGLIPEALYKENLRVILNAALPRTRVFILGANEYLLDEKTRTRHQAPQYQALNRWTRSVARWYRNVTVLNVRDFVDSENEVHDWSHFDRMVYFRIYRKLERSLLK
jgi:predicted phosphohydrolase